MDEQRCTFCEKPSQCGCEVWAVSVRGEVGAYPACAEHSRERRQPQVDGGEK